MDKFGQVEQELRQFATNKVTSIILYRAPVLIILLQISSFLDEILAQHSKDLTLKSSAVGRQMESGLEALFASMNDRDERLSLQFVSIPLGTSASGSDYVSPNFSSRIYRCKCKI